MMKVEADENYCCSQVMKIKHVIDIDKRKETVLLVCQQCSASIELEK